MTSTPSFNYSMNTQEKSFMKSAETSFEFNKPDGTNVSYSFSVSDIVTTEKLASVFDLFKEYSTSDSPEITPKELWQITNSIYKENNTKLEYTASGEQTSCGKSTAGRIIDNFGKASSLYSSVYSAEENGEIITLDEIYEMAELMCGWMGGVEK